MTSLQTGAAADTAESAWLSWWVLNTSNYALWIDRSSCNTISPVLNNSDGSSVVRLDTYGGNASTTQWACDGINGGPAITSADADVDSDFQADYQSSPGCAFPVYSVEGTWVHEVGHNYGYDHFDDWLSTMNTSTVDITSCRSDRRLRPSSDAQQGHDMHPRYGLPAAVDVGGTPIVQNCPISTPGCVVNPATTISVGSGTVNTSVAFTSMNMRDAWTQSSIRVRVWISSNSTLGTGDFTVGDWFLSTAQAGAIYPYTLNFSFTGSSIPLGQTWCTLIQWDPTSDGAEFDETDNITDTGICFHRI